MPHDDPIATACAILLMLVCAGGGGVRPEQTDLPVDEHEVKQVAQATLKALKDLDYVVTTGERHAFGGVIQGNDRRDQQDMKKVIRVHLTEGKDGGTAVGLFSGIVIRDIRLGEGTDMRGLKLEALFRVDRGYLYGLPLVVSMWNFLAFKLPGASSLTDAEVQLAVRDAVLHIEHLLVTGSSMPFDSTGTVTLDPDLSFEEQKIDLLFTVARRGIFVDKVPIVGWIKRQSYDRLQRYFIQAEVKGTLDDPKFRTVPKLRLNPISGVMRLLGRRRASGAPEGAQQ